MVCEKQVTGYENPPSSRMETVHSPPVSADDGLQAKWRSCFHEVGHLLAAAVLLKRTSQAMVFGSGGGAATIGGGVPKSDEEAIAAAAGAVAEDLAAKYPLPQVEMRPCLDVTHPQEADRIKAAMFDDTIMTDTVAIARWCIAGCESRPYRWKCRFDWLEDRTQEFVGEWEQEIVSLATRLFAYGSITWPANPAERN